jgi:hypothetical protein
MLFDLSNIDLTLLNLQKNELIDYIYNEPDNILWGIVELLDALTDQLEG